MRSQLFNKEFPYLLPYGSAKLAEGGRIGYGLGSWLKRKVGLGRREGRAEAAPGRVAVDFKILM